MHRRKILTILGVGTATAALAGCVDESDPDFEDGDTDTNGGGGNGEIVLDEHELVVEEDEFFEEVTVEGTVTNEADETASYVEVRVRVYDEEGRQLDQYFTNTADLAAGRSWAFEVMVLEDAEDVAEYDVAVVDSPF